MVNIDSLTQEMMDELAFSKEEMEALAEARSREIVFEEDCPETTPERAIKFRRVNPVRSNIGKRA